MSWQTRASCTFPQGSRTPPGLDTITWDLFGEEKINDLLIKVRWDTGLFGNRPSTIVNITVSHVDWPLIGADAAAVEHDQRVRLGRRRVGRREPLALFLQVVTLLLKPDKITLDLFEEE